LYKNEDIFKEDSDIDTEFLPQIHFKNLWQCDISDKTKETIWKYLQLIMFSIVGTLENKEAFGDTAKMFEAINEDEFKSKLEETLTQMQGLFDVSGNIGENAEGSGDGINMENMPNAEDIHSHITGMLDGKLGQLAREIAEETAADLNMEFDDATDMKDVFQKLVKNPTKLMGLVKNVGSKLDTKIKSGDIKESELIAEATDMMNKMKNMPGMGNIQSMLNKMGMGNLGGLGGGGKVNTAAMEANLNQKMKMAQTKERMRAKAEANAKAKLEQQMMSTQGQKEAYSEEELLKIFSSGEKVERTPRGAKPQPTDNNTGNKKKKKK
jgi:tetrahydromethanopterin S-methyltransferase subunit F